MSLIKSNKFSKTTKIINFESITLEKFICESSSKGNQKKFFDGTYYLKKDFFGYESLAEVISCIVLRNIRNIPYINYDLCTVDWKSGFCCSKDFLYENLTLVPVGRLLSNDRVFNRTFKNLDPIGRLNLVIKSIKNLTGLDLTEYVGKLIYLDSLILNEDRHLFNIALVFNGSTYLECPIFDNGGSLLSDIESYPLDVPLTINLGRVKSKPFSTSFGKQVRMINSIGVPPIEVDYDKLIKELDVFISSNQNSKKFLERAKRILISQLKSMEGLAWKKV